MIIDDKKILAIELLADGELTKTAVSERVGIARQTLYDWLGNEEFIAALDERLHNRKKFVEKMFDGKLEFVVDKLYELATDDSNKRVQAQILCYLADRSLGRIPSKHELTTKIDAGKPNVSTDILEEEHAKWERNIIDVEAEEL
ncbi:phBC6A51 family helix-turn-helix protein [Fictibacillus phosphorivorans]|uniref:phBC6A51 family helix-turn-helix protein n=1 Tax=Fictibacillus phosphorivorans TaxID=1221500 RepID=UPI00164234CB|nr:phBC6A51 family helix-turn-helix protein [Fictibacillus phosphorivorans]